MGGTFKGAHPTPLTLKSGKETGSFPPVLLRTDAEESASNGFCLGSEGVYLSGRATQTAQVEEL